MDPKLHYRHVNVFWVRLGQNELAWDRMPDIGVIQRSRVATPDSAAADAAGMGRETNPRP